MMYIYIQPLGGSVHTETYWSSCLHSLSSSVCLYLSPCSLDIGLAVFKKLQI